MKNGMKSGNNFPFYFFFVVLFMNKIIFVHNYGWQQLLIRCVFVITFYLLKKHMS